MRSNGAGAAAKLGVLFIGTATLPPLGADTQVHVRILRALDRSTHALYGACAPTARYGVTPSRQALEAIPDLQLVPIDLGPELYLRSAGGKLRGLAATLRAIPNLAKLARYVRHHRVDILHASDRPRDAAACVLVARFTGARCVLHCHNGYGAWMSRLLRWSLRRADARIAVSEFVARTFISNGYPTDGTYVVHNAIDLPAWTPGGDRQSTRLELGLPMSAPVVITVCRLFPSKGPAELIRAFAAVQREHPDARLVIVGRDLSEDGSYLRELTELVRDLAVDKKVIFTGQRDDVPRLLAAADVFAMPSAEEPFGLVFVEAMAMKLPVVALRTGGAPEVVEDGTTGLLSDRGDIEALATNLATLLADERLRREMGDRARERVEQLFTSERMGQNVAKVFRLVQ